MISDLTLDLILRTRRAAGDSAESLEERATRYLNEQRGLPYLTAGTEATRIVRELLATPAPMSASPDARAGKVMLLRDADLVNATADSVSLAWVALVDRIREVGTGDERLSELAIDLSNKLEAHFALLLGSQR